MQIRCPFCNFAIEVKGAKPGVYQPKCGRCGVAFALAIPQAESGEPRVAKTVAELRHPVSANSASAAEASATARNSASGSMAAIILDPVPPKRPETITPTLAATVAPPTPRPEAAPRPDLAATVDAIPRPRPNPAATIAQPPRRNGDSATHAKPPAPPASRMAAAAPPVPTKAKADAPPLPAEAVSNAGRRSADHTFARSGDAPAGDDQIPERLGGYQIIRLLGQGGMGAVHLARQLSLDRLVAVKTIHTQWSADPFFVSRFTREAFAAAQLTHHNVVQIHDIGEEDGTHFFSMEYVEGQSLADHLRQHGKLDPEAAAGYILQAARGLKFAHDHAMVHRDVKPHNLLLNAEGVVKVADLGLVKRQDGRELTKAARGAEASHAHSGAPQSVISSGGSLGSPAYMAPEQAAHPEKVDARADIYSLGCTLYQLLTGQLPFVADDAATMAQLHAKGHPITPEQHNPRVPRTLAQIVLKMMATRPEERYHDVGEVIAALEGFLGVTAGPFTPREEHARALESAVEAFNGSRTAALRRWLIRGFAAAAVVTAAVGAFLQQPLLVSGALATLVFTVLSYGLIVGVLRGPYLFKKVRQYVFGARVLDWLGAGIAAAIIIAMIVVLGQQWLYLGLLVASFAIAAAFAATFDRAAAKDRAPHVLAVQEMLKGMRLRGLEEDALRRFVCKYAGVHWEAFYEALFGYEAKLFARQRWGAADDGRPRKRYGAWRDGMVRWIDERLRERDERRQQRYLQKIEERKLRAEGKSVEEARRKSERTATELVEARGEIRAAGRRSEVVVARMLGRPLPKTKADLEDENDVPESWKISRPTGARRATWLVFGPLGRLAMGGTLLVLSAWWMRQRAVIPEFERGSVLNTLKWFLLQEDAPIPLPIVPWAVERAVSSPHAFAAGVLLILSGFFSGTRQFWLMLPSLALLLAGPQLIPPLLGMPPQITAAIAGVALSIPALWFGRRS